MRVLLSWAIFASLSTTGWATESCAVRVTQLLAAGKSAELVTWFKTPADDTAARLKDAAELFGTLQRIMPTTNAREGKTTRVSIVSSHLPDQYPFEGSWASAVSSKAGLVHIQASSEHGSSCRLLAVHFDRPTN